MADVEMPQLGETVTEGTITRWFKTVGDQVAEDEVLFEVSTDKVDSEVPSPVSGYLAEIVAPEGDTVEVGAVIAVVSDQPPGDAGDVDTDSAGSAPDPGAGSGVAEAEPARESGDQPEPQRAGSSVDAIANGSAEAAGEPSQGGSVLLSPIVRRLAAEHGLETSTIEGTGVGGRITRSDVEQAARRSDGGGSRSAPPASGSQPPPGAERPPPRPEPLARSADEDTFVPFTNIRRRTGEHMSMSRATSPHAVSAVEVDYEAVERVRRAHGESFRAEHGVSLAYLPFIARAVVDALADFPRLNASISDDGLVVHHAVNLSIAVDLDFEGLLAPVVHQAADKRLAAIARDIADLAAKARSKQLGADDIAGGTFTLSNSGSFGSHFVLPIINQPQVAILSTDGVTRRPVVVTAPDGTEGIAIHSVGILAMSWDHRAFDGAYAAAFLAAVREIIEGRDWEAEL
jgi:2-oxoglutarate dehydrogenase E2 component (dihydrolipoamide succinyltransferase)